MEFLWPPVLLLLLTIPLGVWLYRSRERRRAERAAQFGWGTRGGGAAVVATGPPAAAAPPTPSATAPSSRPAAPRSRWARRIPAICTVLGLGVLVLSLARPQSVIGVPRFEGTVVLAFDVSGSMGADDVVPTRMEVAKMAALDF